MFQFEGTAWQCNNVLLRKAKYMDLGPYLQGPNIENRIRTAVVVRKHGLRMQLKDCDVEFRVMAGNSYMPTKEPVGRGHVLYSLKSETCCGAVFAPTTRLVKPVPVILQHMIRRKS